MTNQSKNANVIQTTDAGSLVKKLTITQKFVKLKRKLRTIIIK